MVPFARVRSEVGLQARILAAQDALYWERGENRESWSHLLTIQKTLYVINVWTRLPSASQRLRHGTICALRVLI